MEVFAQAQPACHPVQQQTPVYTDWDRDGIPDQWQYGGARPLTDWNRDGIPDQWQYGNARPLTDWNRDGIPD